MFPDIVLTDAACAIQGPILFLERRVKVRL